MWLGKMDQRIYTAQLNRIEIHGNRYINFKYICVIIRMRSIKGRGFTFHSADLALKTLVLTSKIACHLCEAKNVRTTRRTF